MRLLGLVGSMRKQGNTAKMVGAALEAARERGDDIRLIHISA
ncbi:MAG: NAD(P)H-dependent oxidoreductase [candidate division WOR-3 bacterium]